MPIACGGVSVNPGDIILADPDGVIVIPRKDAPVILEDAKKFMAADAAKLPAAKNGTANRAWVQKTHGRKGLRDHRRRVPRVRETRYLPAPAR